MCCSEAKNFMSNDDKKISALMENETLIYKFDK